VQFPRHGDIFESSSHENIDVTGQVLHAVQDDGHAAEEKAFDVLPLKGLEHSQEAGKSILHVNFAAI